MRKIAFILTFFFMSSVVADAQIFDPRKTAKRKAEQRTNQKIDQTIDKALDKVFNGFGKKKKKTVEKDDSSSDTQSNRRSQSNDDASDMEQDPSKALSGLFGKLGLGGSTPPASSYSFNSSYVMRLKSTGKRKDDNYTMDMKYMFNDGGKVMGAKMVSSDNPEMNKQLQMMEGMVFDWENNQMYTFMNMNGQKQYMGISVKDGAVGDYAAEQNGKVTFTKTGKTKTIAGYPCEAYLSNDGKDEYLVWMSKGPVPSIARYYDAVNKMSANQAKKMAYQVNPEMLKLVQQGRAMLGMEMEDKNTSMEMEVVKISPSDNYTLNTSGYSSMMDMGAIMKQAEEAEKN